MRKLALVLFIVVTSSFAATSPKTGIPPELLPWIPWVLHGQEEKLCPTPYNQADQHQCHLPSRLDLKVFRDRGAFQQQWTLMTEGWVPLPGGESHWPLDVRVAGKPAVVIAKDGAPSLFLGVGSHSVTGAFQWTTLPDGIQVPPRSGLVSLSVDGRAIPFPNLDAAGKLWFQRQTEEAGAEGNHTEVKVSRLVIDEIPLQLQTRIELNVSGEARSLEIGPVLPDGFTPMSIEGELPSVLQPNGLLKTQIRPGRWIVTVTARHEGQVKELAPKSPQGGWPEEEIWAFEAKNHLRMVTTEGVPGIDPNQTTLPDAWKKFPAFLLTAKDTLKLVEKRRGDSDPAADQLTLNRTLWLDFAGKGFSVRDNISGTIKRAWRLEVTPPVDLTRVAVAGNNQLITRRTEKGPAGFEIREGSLNVTAEGRIEERSSFLPTTGWAQDFQSVSATLNLPPGWRAIAITGVDRSTGTWLSFWNLGYIFLAVLLTLAVGKLQGVRLGILTGLALALSFPEHGSPKLAWLFALIALVLYRLIPEGKLRKLVGSVQTVCFLCLIWIALGFLFQQVRQSLYPVLEKPHTMVAPSAYNQDVLERQQPVATRGHVKKMEIEEVQEELSDSAAEPPSEYDSEGGAGGYLGNIARQAAPAPKGKSWDNRTGNVFSLSNNKNLGQKIAQYDPNAIVQVGTGLPNWNWNSSYLSWFGPVSQSEKIGLFLVPPWANLLLSLLRCLGVAALVLLLLKEGWIVPKTLRRMPVDRMVGLLCLLAVGAALPARAADIPTNELLDRLRERVLEAPKCFPQCASLSRMAVEYAPGELTIRFEVSAAIATTIPLPGNARHWLGDSVSIDGKPAQGLSRDEAGQLWLYVPEGSHQVITRGPLPSRESVQLSLPMAAHNVTARGNGWTLEGLHKDGQSDSNLELRRVRTQKGTSGEAWEASNLPPFVLIERELGLGLSWTVRTRISRLTPTGSAVVLAVPVLAGESVTTPGVRVDKGRVLVNMDARTAEFIWDSVLEAKSPILLKPPMTASWTEVWRLDASPIWTVALEGIPVVFHHNDEGRKMPLWRPWPGEEVSIKVERPIAAGGQTLSIPSSQLSVSPGSRATDATLEFSLRSSRGGEHTITLPEGSELQSIEVAGKALPLRPEGNKLVIPVTPGQQAVKVAVRLKGGLKPLMHIPTFDLGQPSLNSTVAVSMPENRWIWMVGGGGAGAGPAVLIWGVILVIIALSILVTRLELTPLTAFQWTLLGVGLTQCAAWDQWLVVGTLLAFGWRRRAASSMGTAEFNLSQLFLVGLTVAASVSLMLVLNRGFFGAPEMHILGNDSYNRSLRWFSDRLSGPIHSPWVVSVPLTVYRLAMLAWALWLAASLLKWAKWGWQCFSESGFWRRKSKLSGTKA